MFIFNLFKVAFCSELQFLVCLKIFNFESTKGRTIRKVKGGGGGWGIFSWYDFFFSRTACAGIFFPGETPCTNFFRQILLFFNSEILIHYLCFVIYKLFYTHNRSKDTGPFLMRNIFENVHTAREEEATRSGRLPCTVFSVPALWNSSPTAHHNDAILHSPTQPLCKVLTLLLHVNALFHFIIESLFKAIRPIL